ncbi:Nucleic-acid-binding protein from mobile element jockey, partial [Melipona quadrifasciata]
KDIYDINKLINTMICTISQCFRCQANGHTKNYCNKRPICFKCTGNYLTSECPQQGEIENVKRYNCKGNHSASYKSCIIRKQLQQKLSPALRKRTVQPQSETQVPSNNRPTMPRLVLITHHSFLNTANRSYAQITAENKTSSHILHLNTNQDSYSINSMKGENTEIKQLLIQSIKSIELLSK